MADSPGIPPAFNYCLAFIDLLGQRDAMKGQQRLPGPWSSTEEWEAFHATLRNGIGPILHLQRDADKLLDLILAPRTESPFRLSLPEEQRAIWDEMQRNRMSTQRWSDGLVAFVCLGDQDIKCPLNAIFGIFALCGIQRFVGLAQHQPARGAIDLAWGIELHPGEIYGPVVARAYELESEVAQYPRVVVGPAVIRYLEESGAYQGDDLYMRLNAELAQVCSRLCVRDADGNYIIHYLGADFRDAVSTKVHQELYERARSFVVEQLDEHRKSKNKKLECRYTRLLGYFDENRPTT